MLKDVSFRKPGFANSLVLRIGLLILFALAAFTLCLYLLIGRPTIDRLGESQMRLAAEQVEARYSQLLKTVEATLRSSQGWGVAGDLEHAELQRFNEFFFPIIANHGEIASVILAHQSGREILLLLGEDGRWINRLSNPAEWGQQTYWITWNARREIESVELRERDYDARQRPWFTGGMALSSDQAIHWTEPYIFYTTGDPGITAAMRWTGRDGSTYIIGHDVRLSSIAEYTTRLAPGSHGQAALFQDDGKLIAPPRDPRFHDRDSINAAVLKTADELGLGELAEGFRRWRAEPSPASRMHPLHRPDGRWLSLFQPLTGSAQPVWLGVVAPESDFVPITSQDLLLLGLITLSALALGMAVAIRIAGQFGEPLKALAEASERIGRLELEQPVVTAAPWREVTQLATALEGMRRQLQSARLALQDANAELEHKIAERTQALRQSQGSLQKREAFFRTIFDNAAVGIISLGPDQLPTRVNRAFADFIGYPIEVLLQNPDTVVLTAPEQARMRAALASVADAGQGGLRSEFEFVDQSGQPRWGDVQIAAVRNENGELDSLLITVLDISDRREIERELIRQFAFLQALLDTIPNPIFYKGADTRFLGCNQAYEEFFGVERRAFIGKRVLDLAYLPEAARQAYQAEDEATIAACSRLVREAQMTSADGSLRDTLYSVSGFRAPDATPGGLIGVIVDITAQKDAEREAGRARAAAESAAAAKADFLANMSHEIRTPMNAIIGMTHLALQTELTVRQKNYLSKVDNAAKGLLGIINDILDLSKIDAGMMLFERSVFSLDATMQHLADLSALKARERGLELLFDIAPEVPDRLIGDSLRLGQVLLNLVGNAIKFTEAGEITVTIKLEDKNADLVELSFEVRDTGIGLTVEQQAQLFSAFTQADTSTTRKYGGTGLGLSICKRIVELQGGRISVSSQPGVGSRFSFLMPFALPAGDAETPARIGLPTHLRTLVVDHSAAAREVFAHMLDALGIEHRLAASGAEALAEINAARQTGQPFGLLIIDWKMPAMDGVELLGQLRQSLAGEAEPAIIISTADDQAELLGALGNQSVGAILGKPATSSSLFDSIVSALHQEVDPDERLAEPAKPAYRLAGRQVLLVEDNEVNRELAEEMLRIVGLTVDLAENGQQAVDRVKEKDYDLILMDCQMPVMDGYEATRHIRRLAPNDRLPIIAMTANALAGDRQLCLAAGMNDHIPKPIDVAMLYATLARWLDSPAQPTPGETPEPAGRTTGDIDTAGALARLGGNQQMYDRLLSRFRENQHDVIDRLSQAWQTGNNPGLILQAHTLRGLAGTIGAVALARTAGELEERLKQNGAPDGPQIERLIARLASELLPVFALAEAIGQEPELPRVEPPDRATQHVMLAELQELLDNDDATTGRYFEELSGWLAGQTDPALADTLARQISHYEFEDALTTLQQIRSKLTT
ncbi:response regulator [Azonexus sp. IMCC34842]|uniref:response regulator n=1 Tax=Azonexus sp. IMCC34842 TaxID=3420950 RepID=UPI003D0BFDA6